MIQADEPRKKQPVKLRSRRIDPSHVRFFFCCFFVCLFLLLLLFSFFYYYLFVFFSLSLHLDARLGLTETFWGLNFGNVNEAL